MRWVQLCSNLSILWHCLSLGLEWKLTFSSPVATAVFHICWHFECKSFTASSFKIWNSSTGIPSPPLAMFVVMLPKAHLASHFRMSGSRWVIIPSWLSGSWRSFLYSSSVYSYYLFFFFSFISWRLITLQYCSGFCHTLTWISHGFTCISHPDPPSHLPLHPIPLGLPSAPGPSICLMHPAWAGDLFHPR